MECRCPHDVAEPGITGERGDLVQNGVTEDGLHRVACLVEAIAKIVRNFGVPRPRQAHCPECRVGQERRKFEQCQLIVGKKVERVSEQFFRAGAKRFQVPALFENLREFPDLNESLRLVAGFEDVQSHGILGICRFNDDDLFTEIAI